MKKSVFFLYSCVFISVAVAQKSINKIPVNELRLNTEIAAYESELFLITGDEEIYKENPNLRENVLRNIANGVREGLYDGYNLSLVDEVRASRTTMFFYNNELYKVRWFFLKQDYPDLQSKSKQLSAFLAEKYGIGEDQIPGLLKVWQSKKRYLQTFSEDSEFQIEYRDEKLHQQVEKLKNN